jgi:TonB-dependent Receptor Plug Domain
MTRRIFFIFSIIAHAITYGQSQVRLSGYFRDSLSGEGIPYASLALQGTVSTSSSNSYGYYTVILPNGQAQRLYITAAGYQPLDTVLILTSDTRLDIYLSAWKLGEVVIRGRAGALQHDAAQVPVERLKIIPMLLGQPDLIKALTFLPGVSAGVEGTTGLYVRGGTPDQNLMLLDGATVYNASHLFGFQSVFDPSAIKDIKFYKGGFPARYGGRLSSIIDITMKEGNNQRRQGEFTLGLINSGLMLEGPIRKGISSYMASGRVAYPGLLLLPTYLGSTTDENRQFNTIFSYDFNLKFNHQFKNGAKVFASVYRGSDNYVAQFLQDSSLYNTQLGWGNRTASLRYVKDWGGRLFSNTLVSYNYYQLRERSRQRPKGEDVTYTFGRQSLVEEANIKQQFSGVAGQRHVLTGGFDLGFHRFQPSNLALDFEGFDLDSLARTALSFNPVSCAAYIEDKWSPVSWLTAHTGLRWSGLMTDGQSYAYWEPRISLTARIRKISLNAAFARTTQFVHLLANNSLGLFSDLWVPATDKVAPQWADQFSGGLIMALPKGWELSVEAYHKQLHNQIDYRQGINFFAQDNINWQNTIEINGIGRAYGTELMLKYERPKYNGWLSYTLSWNERQFANINGGAWFPQRYDRRHNLNITLDRALPKKWRLGANFAYQTGSWVTMPSGKFDGSFDFRYGRDRAALPSAIDDIIIGRNNQRLPDYHRLDLSLTKNYLSKKKKRPAQLVLGVYNVYARRNPFIVILSGSTFYDGTKSLDTEFMSSAYSRAMFTFIPSIAYNLKW